MVVAAIIIHPTEMSILLSNPKTRLSTSVHIPRLQTAVPNSLYLKNKQKPLYFDLALNRTQTREIKPGHKYLTSTPLSPLNFGNN